MKARTSQMMIVGEQDQGEADAEAAEQDAERLEARVKPPRVLPRREALEIELDVAGNLGVLVQERHQVRVRRHVIGANHQAGIAAENLGH